MGRMLALAAGRLGLDVVILDPEPDCPAARVSARHIAAPYSDPTALATLAELCGVVTVEFENVPAGALEALIGLGVPVAPGPRALAIAQDRVDEKTFLNAAGAPTVAFAAAGTAEEAARAAADLGGRVLIKTRREGYDGKGQAWAASPEAAAAVFRDLGGRPVIVEAPAAFRRELSVIAARNWAGMVAAFPLAENVHENGILRRSTAPARGDANTAQRPHDQPPQRPGGVASRRRAAAAWDEEDEARPRAGVGGRGGSKGGGADKGGRDGGRKRPGNDKGLRKCRREKTEKQAAKARQTERLIERLEVVEE